MSFRHLLAAAVVGAPLLGAPATVHAQDGFLFRAPVASVTLRAGPLLPRAHGDLFGFLTDTLTLDRGDFRMPFLGAEVAVAVASRWDLALAAGWAETEKASEFRDWVGADDLPIVQDTWLRVVPLTLSGRYYPLPRGRAVSRLAWLPARTTPYVGAGAGVTWYSLRQAGEFIDADRVIFESTRESNGHGFTGHGLVGLDHWFTSRIGLNAEARYILGSGSVGGDFQGWDGLDLSGLQLAVGVSFRW
jgi:hypothetical protein